MIIFQKWITRHDLRANPDVLYLFGDNEEREGFGGQAKEMRGEPNAVGVRTKRAPGMLPEDFWDENPEHIYRRKTMIDDDMLIAFDHVKKGGTVVVPLDGLGTGLSELPTRAPSLYQRILNNIDLMKYIGK